MEEKKSERKFDWRFIRHLIWFIVRIVLIIGIWCFIYSCAWDWCTLNNEEYQLCKEVAEDIWNARENGTTIEFPNGFNVMETSERVSVSESSYAIFEKVEIKLQDGELITERILNTKVAILFCMTISFVCTIILLIIYDDSLGDVI